MTLKNKIMKQVGEGMRFLASINPDDGFSNERIDVLEITDYDYLASVPELRRKGKFGSAGNIEYHI